MGLHDGKVAIVTGAAQGIGFAVASRLAEQGAQVVLGDLQSAKVEAAAARIDPNGRRAIGCAVDVSDTAAVSRLIEVAVGRFGGVDVLANVAGGSGSVIVEQIEDMTDEIWNNVVASNLRGTFVCSRAVVPIMKKAGRGAIVNFATGSIRGFQGKSTSAARLAYVSAKAGIIGFTNQLSGDLKRFGIAVNVIQPGFVLTEPGARIRTLFDSLPKADQDAMLARRTPRTPEELGWATAFVAAQGADALTGTALRLSGPMVNCDLKIIHDPEGQLASTAKLEQAFVS